MERVNRNTPIILGDSVTNSAVYVGGMTWLQNVTDKLDWHTEEVSGMDIDTLTLAEIEEQLKDCHIITVVEEALFGGSVYQFGNYASGEWWKIGELAGFA